MLNRYHLDYEHRQFRVVQPTASRVAQAADEFESADMHEQAALLVYWSYWPSLVCEMLLEVNARKLKRKKQFHDEMTKVKRRLNKEESYAAPHSRETPAVIPLPDILLHQPVEGAIDVEA